MQGQRGSGLSANSEVPKGICSFIFFSNVSVFDQSCCWFRIRDKNLHDIQVVRRVMWPIETLLFLGVHDSRKRSETPNVLRMKSAQRIVAGV